MKNAVCRWCEVNFVRKGEYKDPGASNSYCSDKCRTSDKRLSKCQSHCKLEDIVVRTVKYKDGTEHKRRSCTKCKRARYVGSPSLSPAAHLDKVKKKVLVRQKILVKRYGESFYTSRKWLELRYSALLLYGRKCVMCGHTNKLHVDHIKPRSKHPELELDIQNLQILCGDCNIGKSNKDQTDLR